MRLALYARVSIDGGWVCRAAQAMGVLDRNGKHIWVRLRSAPAAGGP